MTEKQQIKAALKLLAPPAGQRAACEDDIEFALATIAVMTATEIASAGISKAEKDSVRSYLKALQHAKAARAQLKGMLSIWDKTDFETPIDLCNQRLSRPSAPPHRLSARQRHAAEYAYRLLIKWNAQRTPTTTRRGPWYLLAAILYGDETADLFDHLREYQKTRRKPGSK